MRMLIKDCRPIGSEHLRDKGGTSGEVRIGDRAASRCHWSSQSGLLEHAG